MKPGLIEKVYTAAFSPWRAEVDSQTVKLNKWPSPRLHGGNRADWAAWTIPVCAFGSGYYSQNGSSRLPHTCRSASRRIYLVIQPTAYRPDIASTGGFRHHR